MFSMLATLLVAATLLAVSAMGVTVDESIDIAQRVAAAAESMRPVAEFVNVTYDFSGSPWGDTAADAEAAGAFVLQNNVVTGVNFYRMRNGTELLFACVPRWRHGVPSTLNVVAARAGPAGQDILRPWPSWEFNTRTVRYVQSVWVDQVRGWIYVIDAGRENFFDANASAVVNGPAALIVLDIETQRVVYSHVFATDIFLPNSSFLNDIVVDEARNIAFMSDTNVAGLGALVMHDMTTGVSRRFAHPSTLAEPWYHVTILNVSYGFNSPADGITLSADGRRLFYSVIQGAPLFSLDAFAFASPNASYTQIAASVDNITQKASFSDGLRTLPSAHGDDIVLYGAIGECALYAAVLRRSTNGTSRVVQQQRVAVNATTLQWIDTFAFVPKASGTGGALFFTSNRLQRYFANTMDYSGGEGANMRIFAALYDQ